MDCTLSKLILVVWVSSSLVSSASVAIDPAHKQYLKLKEELISVRSNISVQIGVGYSSDAQQVTQQRCYNATVRSISERSNTVNLKEAVSFSDLQKIFKIDVSASGRYGMFSGNAMASYMRYLRDKDYTMSLSYYVSYSEQVTTQIQDFGVSALTEFGQKAYSQNHRYFGLLCGDSYVASYGRGATLIAGLSLEFHSHEQKKEFIQKAGVKFGGLNLISAAEKIERVSSSSKISGSIVIHGYQIGGDPTRLTRILNSDVVRCDITSMKGCLNTAKTLLDYAQDFGDQLKDNSTYEPLPGEATYNPIKYLGLAAPESLVTPEVAKLRVELATKLKENEYYIEKFHSIRNGYRVALAEPFVQNASLILSRAEGNVKTLMDPHTGAVVCYNDPERCAEIKASVDSNLRSVTPKDLEFMKDTRFTLEAQSWAWIFSRGVFINNGGGTDYSWVYVNLEGGFQQFLGAMINDTFMDYQIIYQTYGYTYHGKYYAHANIYAGCYVKNINQEQKCSVQYEKKASPFFFEDYHTMLNKTQNQLVI